MMETKIMVSWNDWSNLRLAVDLKLRALKKAKDKVSLDTYNNLYGRLISLMESKNIPQGAYEIPFEVNESEFACLLNALSYLMETHRKALAIFKDRGGEDSKAYRINAIWLESETRTYGKLIRQGKEN